MILSYQPLLATGFPCVQTWRWGVFILSDWDRLFLSWGPKPAAQSPNLPWTQGAPGFLSVSYPLQCATFSYYLLLLLAGASFEQGCSSPLWSLAALPFLNPFLQNKDLALFHSARSWITSWAVRSLPDRFARVSKMELGSRLPLTWLMAALTSIPWGAGLTHRSDALLQVFY